MIQFELLMIWDNSLFSCLNVADAMECYYNIFDGSGWTKLSYEAELLKRIDIGWDVCRSN